MQIRFKKLHPDAKLPVRGSAGAAGYDLYAATFEDVGDISIYGTGLAVEIPEGYCGVIYPRSSGIFREERLHGPTIIDSDYRGEVKLMFSTFSRYDGDKEEIFEWLREHDKDTELARSFFKPGERIAQLVVQPFVAIEPVWAETLSETQRDTGGYGSTGA